MTYNRHRANPKFLRPCAVPLIRDALRTPWIERWQREFAQRWTVRSGLLYPVGAEPLARKPPTYLRGR